MSSIFFTKMKGVFGQDVCVGRLCFGAHVALVSIASRVSCGRPGASP